ncbi:integral membrane sensor signal transduction histidine kinase [Cellulomonas gilvus ATCC 13127]|uniref:histidine kinase n=2 Tax=Cellulomonas gilvus TaxID=11 RepID=F8A2U8_CELGA|nr:integral membrane sensor signal transduction histidine kinase [Cellulomonas gilvus ATCC 13127]
MSEKGPARGGIAARLMVAMALVLISAAAAAWLVAGAVGPGLFHHHMEAAANSPGDAIEHAEKAFAAASTVTVAVALTVSLLTALFASVVLARRIGASLGSLSAAAGQVAAGRFDIRLEQPHVGVEFDDLADAFNAMAGRLERDEALRRRLMSDVAHELRTPVATIAAYIDAIEDGVEELGPRTVEVLHAQAARLTRLSTDLAAVTQAESGALRLEPREITPDALVERAVAAARTRADDAGLELVAMPEPDLPELWVDVDRLGQVLGNLLDNAIRHTPPGGTVSLAAQRTDVGVRFTVTDTGEGIAAEHLPHVFERFYRADAARDRGHGGSGIGLAIAKALVEAHDGSISALSAGPGRGASFVVDLAV